MDRGWSTSLSFLLLGLSAQAAAPALPLEQVLQFPFHCDQPRPSVLATPETWQEQTQRHIQVFQECVSEALQSASAGVGDRHPYSFMDGLLDDIQPFLDPKPSDLPSRKKVEAAFERLEGRFNALLRRSGASGENSGAPELRELRRVIREVRGSATDSAESGVGMFSATAASALYFQSLAATYNKREAEVRRLFCDWKRVVDAAIVWERMERPPVFPRTIFNCRS